jgi:hypothetical protein
MGIGRLAPHRVRAKYARALAEIPLPVRSFERIDPSALQILAETDIGDRRIQFGVLAATPRLWIAFTDEVPPVLGYLTGLIGLSKGTGVGTGTGAGAGAGTYAGTGSGVGTGAGTGAGSSSGGLQLHITELDHLEWVRHTGRARRIKTAALAVWNAAQRECEG